MPSTIYILDAGTIFMALSTVNCISELLPVMAIKGLGTRSVLTGQKRSPLPPAMITTNVLSIFAPFAVDSTRTR